METVVLSTGTSTIVAVKPPEGSSDLHIKYWQTPALVYLKPKGEFGHGLIPLPAGQYSILGWSDEISVEQMKVILPPPFIGVETYLWDFEKKFFSARSYTESYASFLTANNIERELLLIKK